MSIQTKPHRWASALGVWNQQALLDQQVATGDITPLRWGEWFGQQAPATGVFGYVTRQLAGHLASEHGDVFAQGESLTFTESFARETHAKRTAAMARIAEWLAQSGALAGWRGEHVHVAASYGAAPVFDIERASSRVLGLVAYAAHLNGYCKRDGRDALWIATRSSRKSVDPGKFDNMVGGRISAGFTAIDTMRKEAWEEAGVPPELAANIRAVGAVSLCYATPDGWHREVLFTHDLFLPPDFEPANQDGEVARFDCFDVDTLIPLTTDPHFTLDAAAVTVAWLIRRGHIPAEHPDYFAIQRTLAP